MRRRSMFCLWFVRGLAALGLILTAGMACLRFYNFTHPWSVVRTDWNLTPTTDDWRKIHIQLVRGTFTILEEHFIEAAFTGQSISDVPFSPNRTDPTGVVWETAPPTFIESGAGEGPAWLDNRGLAWQTRQVETSAGAFQMTMRWVQVSLWLPIAFLALLTIGFSWLWRRAGLPFRRLRAGLCPNCGYDLRSSPDRCPECGRLPLQASGAVEPSSRGVRS